MYLILGATGQVGGHVLKAIQRHRPGAPLRIVSRRPPETLPAHADWREIDLARDAEGLASAMEGVSTAFVMNPVPPDAGDVYREAAAISRTIADAIERAGKPRVVALSSQGAQLADGTGVITVLHDFETALRGTGAPLTAVRSTFFMESWLPFAAAALESGQWWAMRSPPDARDAAVSARDVGAVIADCMLAPEAPAIVNVTGARSYSEVDAVAILSSLAGRGIELVTVPAAERAGVLEAAGLGPSYAAALAAMYDALDAGRVPFEAAADVRLGSTPLEDVLNIVAGAGPR